MKENDGPFGWAMLAVVVCTKIGGVLIALNFLGITSVSVWVILPLFLPLAIALVIIGLCVMTDS